MKKIILIAFILLSTKSNACLNIFSVDSTGRVHHLEHYFFFPIEFRQDYISKNLKALERKFNKKEYGYKNISDYGAYLLMAGHFKEGLDLFRALSKKYPAVYEVAANIAVAYELNSNIDSAIYWEKAAIAINPIAHKSTEWVHLKILEAKKKTLSDPYWCLNNNVTGIVELIKERYVFNQNENVEGNMFSDLIYQLEERFSFTYAEDKVMGKLLFELGDAYQAASTFRSYYCYAIAKYLYPALSVSADEKMSQITRTYPKGAPEGNSVSDREKKLPDDNAVKKLIDRIVNRPPINNNLFTFINIEKLISNIQ